MGMAIQSKGLTMVPKLKQEHISLTSYSRIRVDLAAQVKRLLYLWQVDNLYTYMYNFTVDGILLCIISLMTRT